MATTLKTWTAAEIEGLFCEAHEEADAATREATSGPFNPYGDAFVSLVWCGTPEEARDQKGWPAMPDPEDYEDGAQDADPDAAAKAAATTVVGTGRAIFVAFCDGAYPAVFCEQADEDAVREAVASFYDAD